tara:strand:- start:384 stop:3230 length:2847 start_codon:yes stop_codon:yes gene_type:complete
LEVEVKHQSANKGLVGELVFVALFLSLTVIYFLFGEIDLALSDFSKVQVSQATNEGIAISKRVSIFYKIIGVFTLLLPSFYFLLKEVKVRFRIARPDLQLVAIFSCSGIGLLLSNAYGMAAEKGVITLFVLVISFLVLFILKKRKPIFRLISNRTFIGGFMIVSIILLGTFQFLGNSSKIIVENGVLCYLLILVTLILIALMTKRFAGISINQQFNLLLPLSLAPILLFASTEALFWVKQQTGDFIAYKWIFMGLLALFMLGYWGLRYFKPVRISSHWLFTVFYAPSALLMFLLYSHYSPILPQSYELFELANPANAQLRMFSFGEIPFVDFLTSHMFAEQFYGVIYNLMFEFNGTLDFLVYQFFYTVIFFFIVYHFLVKLLKSPFLALLFIITFPLITNLFHEVLFFTALCFFAIKNLVANQSIKNFLWLFVLLAALCIWRLDTGVAAIGGSLLFLPIHYFTEKRKIQFGTLTKGLALFAGLILGTLLLLILLSSVEHIISSIRSALHYFSGSQAHGFSTITLEYNQQFFLFHVVYPLASILIICYTIYYLRTTNSSHSRFNLNTSLFFLLVYLVNFQRGLVRHGFIESVDFFLMATFYIGIALFVLSFMQQKGLNWKYVQFYSISFLLILCIKYFPFHKEDTRVNRFFETSSLAFLDYKFNDSFKGRTTGKEEFAEKKYLEIKQFLDANLTNDQTFLDFSNTPTLYFYCQRKVPSYFCQSLQNTVDDYLQNEQLEKINMESTPVVIYSNYPPNWWDNTDYISNSMRQNLIAEYIYSNYKPYRIMNDHSIWIGKNFNATTSIEEKDTLIGRPRIYHYKHAAVLLNKYFDQDGKSRVEKLQEVNPVLADTSNCYKVEVNDEVSGSSLVLAKIELTTNGQEEINLELYSDSTFLGYSTFMASNTESEYLVPLSNHYLWHSKNVNSIWVSTHEGVEVNKITFYRDIRNEY